MRVMVVSRLFSGFSDSLTTGTWRPKGQPAIYKLLEALAAAPDIDLISVFGCKDETAGKRFAGRRWANVDRLGVCAILPYRRRRGLAAVGLDTAWREITHAARCLWLYLRHRPDVIYFTNANFAIAALFARLGLGRVILRFMGMFPAEQALALSRGGFVRWLYAAPFDHVVCTQEGSGAEWYLPRLLRPSVPLSILLNGVDRDRPSPEQVETLRASLGLTRRPTILFVGRLETMKGCVEFLDAALLVLKERPGAGQFVIAGSGSLKDTLLRRLEDAGRPGDIHLLDGLPHDSMPAVYATCDIYVSLNKHGNLSNANLEALAAGKCLVVLEGDPAAHIDQITESLLPRECARRVSRADISRNLADTLITLLDRPEQAAAHAAAARRLADKILIGWDERVSQEISIILGSFNTKASCTSSASVPA